MAAQVDAALQRAIADQRAAQGDHGSTQAANGMEFTAQWVTAGANAAEQTDRLETVRRALGSDQAGVTAFTSLLIRTQSPVDTPAPQTRDAFQGAFSGIMSDGTWTANDTHRLVQDLGRRSIGNEETGKLQGDAYQPHIARAAALFEDLGTGARATAARSDFVTQSLAQAHDAESRNPGASRALDAAAAQVMGHQTGAEIARELDAISMDDSQAVARFGRDALRGAAQVIDTGRMETQYSHAERGDGLAKTMTALSEHVTQSRRDGHPDPRAESQLANLFTGTMQGMSQLRETDAGRLLMQNDDKTGLRAALNNAVRSDFQAILSHNMLPNGQGLAPAGIETFATYARTEFGGNTNTEATRRTAADAQALLGTVLGRLEHDVAQTETQGSRAVRAEFGQHTFGPADQAGVHAARTLGQITEAVRVGIDQDGEDRRQQNRELRRSSQAAGEMFDVISQVASAESRLAPLAGAAGIASALARATPLAPDPGNAREKTFTDMQDRFQQELADRSPRTNLGVAFEDGKSSANNRRANDRALVEREEYNRESEESRRGPLASVAGRLVPAPIGPPQTSGPEDVAAAVREYNGNHRASPLPEPDAGQVKPWDHRRGSGTLLLLDENTYALHVGQGQYRLLDREADLHGQTPPVDSRIRIDQNGNVTPDVPAPQLQRT